jgi:hypothetical protein
MRLEQLCVCAEIGAEVPARTKWDDQGPSHQAPRATKKRMNAARRVSASPAARSRNGPNPPSRRTAAQATVAACIPCPTGRRRGRGREHTWARVISSAADLSRDPLPQRGGCGRHGCRSGLAGDRGCGQGRRGDRRGQRLERSLSRDSYGARRNRRPRASSRLWKRVSRRPRTSTRRVHRHG